MKVEFEPLSERFDPLDDRWLDQVAQLTADLRREVGAVTGHSEPVPGMKGVELGPIVVSLSSAGALSAVVGIIKAFIDRDRGRSVRASWHQDGKPEQIVIRGHSRDDAEQLISALRQTAEPSE